MGIMDDIKSRIVEKFEQATSYIVVVQYMDGKQQVMSKHNNFPEAMNRAKDMISSYSGYSLRIFVRSNNGKIVPVFENHALINKIKKDREREIKEYEQRMKAVKEVNEGFTFGGFAKEADGSQYNKLGLMDTQNQMLGKKRR